MCLGKEGGCCGKWLCELSRESGRCGGKMIWSYVGGDFGEEKGGIRC